MPHTSEIISKTKGTDPRASQVNPNSDWLNLPGAWSVNFLMFVILRALLALVPGLSNDWAWTVSYVFYLTGHFITFHMLIGAPFESTQGEFDGLTLWEQIDNGAQFTPTKKFLTALPIVLFLISAHYTHYNAVLFAINLVPLIIVLIAKLPALHRVRFFGINKVE